MINRRRFLSLSAGLVAGTAWPGVGLSSGVARAETPAELPDHLLPGSKKKGLGLGMNHPHWARLLEELRCKWVYTWTGKFPENLPTGMQFIPMVRSRFAQFDRLARLAEEAKVNQVQDLLGLNEPDAAKQDNMSVADALDVWPLLMETGLRLGSPGCIHPDNDWMLEFMAGVEKRGLRVDFICVHSYGPPNASAFLRRLERVHELYDRPLWITEFGVGDWKAQTVEDNMHAPETVQHFMESVLPKLDELDYLERYAWFPSPSDNPALGTSALFDPEGKLTPLGECYREA